MSETKRKPTKVTCEQEIRSNRMRRSHPKTRTGCSTCKARKIKCDEHHPSCANCLIHGVKCPFLDNDQDTSARQTEPTSMEMPMVTATVPDLQLFDLELLHHFVTVTCFTMSTDQAICDFWRRDIIRAGIHCDYVMRAILALSALHLATLRPAEHEYYASRGLLYHRIASRKAMHLMVDEPADEMSGLFLFSILTIYFGIACQRETGEYLGANEHGIPTWVYLLQGSRTIFALSNEQAYALPLGPFLLHCQHRNLRIEDNTATLGAFQKFRDGIASSVTADDSARRVYTKAVDLLERTLDPQDVMVPGDIYDVFIWLFHMSNDLVPLLLKPEQTALAIFVQFCVLLKAYDGWWWLHGWPVVLVEKASGVLDQEHKSWVRWSEGDAMIDDTEQVS